jgi:hypothetical protein
VAALDLHLDFLFIIILIASGLCVGVIDGITSHPKYGIFEIAFPRFVL